MKKPITAIIVGGGHRSFIYADYSLKHPDELKIVGIADPDKSRRDDAAQKFGFSEEYCFNDALELASHGRLADVIINGTMDQDHVATSVPLLDLQTDSRKARRSRRFPHPPRKSLGVDTRGGRA